MVYLAIALSFAFFQIIAQSNTLPIILVFRLVIQPDIFQLLQFFHHCFKFIKRKYHQFFSGRVRNVLWMNIKHTLQ